ncbi:VOC family protein [Chelativorans sp. YIM 93263]|uniref:VOC family protein n=1 Tax=Chelativorans sp. YIM 93263 TaxID=2906648 RepID=UPI002379E116|nr:VOC family protein [Chelativorans sp. YIM 93263]
MAKAVGIGGLFFRAADPQALAQWYETHLGVTEMSKGVWQQERGPTIIAPYPVSSDYLGSQDQKWMLNFRVDDLDGLIGNLQAAGVAVETSDEWNSYVGRFARIHDPEGNPIELWEPTDQSSWQ